ncbi:odorant receptor Or2-like [Chrysoperla carnea]|uniref:odorant receptor Or2-like n=1 Tax=Chrysoperla carnea TaxID=189513 RepID=UPI001D08B167|nr:odorant receptor Or2-like [Chrysoperla carnea]
MSIKPTYLEKSLEESINHHIKILNICTELEQIIHLMVLIVFLGSVILLCFLLFQTSMTPIASIKFLQSASYCFTITVQIFLYCWWGNEVSVQSEKVAESISEINYVGTTTKFQKSLIFIMKRAQKPIVFTAGKFSALSVETYSAIIRGSFSYYTILHRMNDPENL